MHKRGIAGSHQSELCLFFGNAARTCRALEACLLLDAACSCASGAKAGDSTCQLFTLRAMKIDTQAPLMLGSLEQVVVILGTGAFACEAMEASLRNGAKHVYLLSRERVR